MIGGLVLNYENLEAVISGFGNLLQSSWAEKEVGYEKLWKSYSAFDKKRRGIKYALSFIKETGDK